MEERINLILEEKSFCEAITPELSLLEDLGLDSLSMVELIVSLEDEFDIEIDESDLDPSMLQTVAQIYNLIHTYREE